MKKTYKKVVFGTAVLAACLVFAFATCKQNLSDTLQSGLADITYTAEANGDPSTISTKINFVFSADVRRLGLKANDITIVGAGAADKHNLTPTDATGTRWTLDITVTAGGAADVSIEKASIEAGKKGVTLHKSLYVVRGIIRTSIGAARGAVVKLMQGGDVKGVARASSSGNYSIGAAAGSGYTVQVSLAGFVIETLGPFDITAADPPPKDITLQALLDLENNFPFPNPGFWTYTARKHTGGSYYVNVYTITSGATVTIVGNAALSGIEALCVDVAAGPKPTNITLDGVTINTTSGTDWGGAALGLAAGAEVVLTLADNSINSLTAGGSGAGVEVPEGATLTITGDITGKLTAEGSSLENFFGGAGIGGGSWVHDGKTGSAGTITITGGTIVATGGSPTILPYFYSDFRGGAGIGSGGFGSTGGIINISGGAHVTATGGEQGAGIGGGVGSASGTITISGCHVDAESKYDGAAIGGGGGDPVDPAGNSDNISISGNVTGSLTTTGKFGTPYHVGPGVGGYYVDTGQGGGSGTIPDGVKKPGTTITVEPGAFPSQVQTPLSVAP